MAPLVSKRQKLKRAVDELKAKKGEIGEVAYLRQLEILLVELARVSRQIRLATAG
jgi:hypothetical protein